MLIAKGKEILDDENLHNPFDDDKINNTFFHSIQNPIFYKLIGIGTFGKVYECQWKNSLFALKVQTHIHADSQLIDFKTLNVPHNNFEQEMTIQKKTASHNLAPKIEYSISFVNLKSIWSKTFIGHDLAIMRLLDTTIWHLLFEEKFNDEFLSEQIVVLIKNLHNCQIFHGDLHARNIMVDSQKHPYLIDFGKSKFMDKFHADQKVWCQLHDYTMLATDLPRKSKTRQLLIKECENLIPNERERNLVYYDFFNDLLKS